VLRDIVVINASAGGVAALHKVIERLPTDLSAAVFVVLHMSPNLSTKLPEALNRAGSLPAILAEDGDAIRQGEIYLAPPDRHLIIVPSQVRVTGNVKEHFTRPAGDPTLRSAAAAYGTRVVGIVLTGCGRNGAAGLRHVKREGGLVIVQDPEDAAFSGMPEAALSAVKADHCVPLSAIGDLVARACVGPRPLPTEAEAVRPLAAMQ
jgi:two-component system chemotaxis response regulator CheB